MLDVLNFIFSSFWTWLGTVILLGTCLSVIIGMIILLANARNP